GNASAIPVHRGIAVQCCGLQAVSTQHSARNITCSQRVLPGILAPQFFKLTLRFVMQHAQFFSPLTHPLDNLRRSLRQELIVPQLLSDIPSLSFYLLQFLDQALTLEANVD